MKVIYTGYSIHEPYRAGETDGKVHDKQYLRINGEMHHKDFTFPDTPENRQRLDQFQRDYKAWKELEPNPYKLLNAMQML